MNVLLKKSACIAAVTVLALSSVSCGNGSSSSEPVTTESSTAASTDEATAATAATETETATKAEPTAEPSSGTDVAIKFSDLISDSPLAPALWRATDPATGNSLYMMGTIHITQPDLLDFPDYILDVYDSCEGIAIEYDTEEITGDAKAMQAFVADMIYTDGSDITDHISAETYEKAKEFLTDKGMYSPYYDMLMPGFWVDLVSVNAIMSIDGIAASGVETYFIEKCKNDGKAVVSIEELDVQKNLLIGYSDALADYELSNAVDSAGDIRATAEAFAVLYDCWACGDIDRLTEYSEEEVPDDLRDDYEEYQDIVLHSRNKHMAEKAAEYLRDGKNYFFMVGSLHFAGNDGVDDILTGMGYAVERLH